MQWHFEGKVKEGFRQEITELMEAHLPKLELVMNAWVKDDREFAMQYGEDEADASVARLYLYFVNNGSPAATIYINQRDVDQYYPDVKEHTMPPAPPSEMMSETEEDEEDSDDEAHCDKCHAWLNVEYDEHIGDNLFTLRNGFKYALAFAYCKQGSVSIGVADSSMYEDMDDFPYAENSLLFFNASRDDLAGTNTRCNDFMVLRSDTKPSKR